MGNKTNNDGRTMEELLQSMRRYRGLKEKLDGSLFNFDLTRWVDTTDVDPDGFTYNVADLFAGAGGLTLGFDQANYQSLFGIEQEPDSAATYERNFPDAVTWNEDIRDVPDRKIKKAVGDRQVHVLLAGFPCPGFSVAGNRDVEDERNYLYKEILRIAKVVKPWFLALENVPGLCTIGGDSKTLHKIRGDFEELGYPLSTHILEAADYGVPQFRSRAILVGNRFGRSNPYPEAPLTEDEYIPIEEAIGDLEDVPRDPSINHEWTNHRDSTIESISKVEPGESLYDTYRDAWKRQREGLPSMAVKENHGGTHIHHKLNRVISAREMARLQGFPDDFIFEGRMKRVMFQVGNAVPVPLANHVALAIRTELDSIRSELGERGIEQAPVVE